ncbi:unnamed protein product, partial [Musa textilis]
LLPLSVHERVLLIYLYACSWQIPLPLCESIKSLFAQRGAMNTRKERAKGEAMEKEEAKAPDVGLKELSNRLEEFARERDWEQYHSPRNLLLAMVGEVGELAEIFMWRGEVAKSLPNWEESEKEHLGEELSDVLLYLIRLSDICGIDLGDAATKKIVKNAIKYPAKAT